MEKRSLIETNPHVSDAKKRHIAFAKSAASSTVIEGVHVRFKKVAKSESACGVKAVRRSLSSSSKRK
jgi:hypothetical protein